MIQENDQEISIVEPSTNETFRILAEINLKLSKDYTKIYDDKLFVSANIEDKELNIFDKS